MAVSDISRHRQESSFWKRLLGQLSRYDLLLAAIPFSFALALVTSLLAAVPLHVAVGASALVSGVLVADALYVHPPTAGRADATEVDDSVAGHAPERGD